MLGGQAFSPILVKWDKTGTIIMPVVKGFCRQAGLSNDWLLLYQSMYFNEALEQYTKWKQLNVKGHTVRQYELILRQFGMFLRNKDIESISDEDVTEWLRLHSTFLYDHNTMVPRTIALRKFFEYWKHKGMNVFDPWLVPVAHAEREMPRIADEENFKKMLSVIPFETGDHRHIRNRALAWMYWDTGARNSEILSLDMNDIDISKRKGIIKTEKNKGSRQFREIFWNQETNESLKIWIDRREYLVKNIESENRKIDSFKEGDENAIFIGVLNKSCYGRISNKAVGEAFRNYCNKAEVPYINIHSLRHRKAHSIIHQDGSSADVMNILGHASLASSSIYVMMNDKELEGRARKFMDM